MMFATTGAAAGEPPDDRTPPSTGPYASFGTDVAALGGSIAQGWTGTGLYGLVDLRVGYYFTNHLGVVIGAQTGTGGLFDGCGSSSCSNALTFQFPVMAQWAFESRLHGAFAEGGIAIAPNYIASTSADSNDSPTVLRFSAPFDVKVGAGYRWMRYGAFELRADLDVGKFTYVSATTVDGSASGDIVGGQQALHYTAYVGMAYVFGR